MKTKTIKLYEFKELSEEVKVKVLNEFRNNNECEFLSDDLQEELKQILEENKIKYEEDLKVYYSLSYCQGDGVCFIGTFKTSKIEIKIKHKSRDYHELSTDLEVIGLKIGKEFKDYYDLTDKQQEKAEELLNKFKEKYVLICKQLEKIGYDYIDFENSEENLTEKVEQQEFYFRKNGEIENF